MTFQVFHRGTHVRIGGGRNKRRNPLGNRQLFALSEDLAPSRPAEVVRKNVPCHSQKPESAKQKKLENVD